MQRPTFAQIDLGALAHNLHALRSLLKPDVEVIGVVKADAYGHGAVEVSRTLAAEGVKRFAVAILDEAIQLHDAKVPARIILLGALFPDEANEVVAHGLEPVVTDFAFAEALSREAIRQDRPVDIHVKFDTGMGRMGFHPENAMETIERIASLPGLRITGGMSHFAAAEDASEAAFTQAQIQSLCEIRKRVEQTALNIPLWHIANSAGILWFPEAHMNTVRPGVALYGALPDCHMPCPVSLRQVMSLKTHIGQIRDMADSTTVGYSRSFRVERASRIAVLSLGYADGFDRRQSNRGEVLIRGKRAPIVGRVCMDLTMADVTDIPEASPGDEVVVYGTQGPETISINQIAETLQTVPHAVMAEVGARVPRVYVNAP